MWAGRLSLRICDEAAERDEATAGRSHREVRDLLVGVREMEELQERLAEVEVERDEALARCRRRDAQLIELAESQRTMQEHAQIISADNGGVTSERPSEHAEVNVHQVLLHRDIGLRRLGAHRRLRHAPDPGG